MSIQTSAKQCNSLIKRVGELGANYEELVHEAAVACIEHARKYHDVTLMKTLINTIAATCKGYVANELTVWFKNNAPVEFTYSADKKTIENVKELKDSKSGELVKQYAASDVIENSPMHKSESVTNRTQRKITPFSITYVQQQVGRLESQLKAAIEPGGKGIVIGVLNDQPVIVDKTDPRYKPAYDKLLAYVTGLKEFADKVISLPPAQATKAADAIVENVKEAGTDQLATMVPGRSGEVKQPATEARGKQRRKAA